MLIDVLGFYVSQRAVGAGSAAGRGGRGGADPRNQGRRYPAKISKSAVPASNLPHFQKEKFLNRSARVLEGRQKQKGWGNFRRILGRSRNTLESAWVLRLKV